MKKHYINGKEVSALEKTQHKIKQLNEAISLLEEFSDRLTWADDFAHYPSIKEALDSPYTAVEQAKDELEEELCEIENCLEELNQKKQESEIEIEYEFEQNIERCLS